MLVPDVLVLRAGTPADIDLLYELDVRCFAPPFRFSRRTMAQLVRSARYLTLIAELSGKLAGFLIGQFTKQDAAVYLATLDVDPGMRRAGVASQLMEELERLARERGAERVMLHVAVRNEAASAFYRSRGYVQTGCERDYYAPGEDAWELVKRVTEPAGREERGGAGRDRTGA